MADRLTFYRSGLRREWRWRYQDGGNRRNLANAGEGYKNREDAMTNAFRVLGILSNPPRTKFDTAVEKQNGETVYIFFR